MQNQQLKFQLCRTITAVTVIYMKVNEYGRTTQMVGLASMEIVHDSIRWMESQHHK